MKPSKKANQRFKEYIQFKPQINLNQLSQKIRDKITDNRPWHISFQQYQQKYWNKIFLNLISYRYENIAITHSYSLQSCSMIENVSFRNLKILDLQSNSIVSIEFLAFINAPQLSQLYLPHNRITNIKPLKKMVSQLEIFSVEHNNILQNSQYSSLYWPKTQNQAFWIIMQLKDQRDIDNRLLHHIQSNTQFINFMSKLQVCYVPYSQIQEMRLRYYKKPNKNNQGPKYGKQYQLDQPSKNLITQNKVLKSLFRKFLSEFSEQILES